MKRRLKLLLISSSFVLAVAATAQTEAVVAVEPGESIQAAVDNNPEGTTFLIRSGVHRLQRVRPKHRNTFKGEAGAILNGAVALTSFTREGSLWVASDLRYGGERRGICLPTFPRCTYPEDLFLDNVRLVHAESLDKVSVGSWFYDYNQAKVYLADNPSNRLVELAVTRDAFYGTAENVTIRGLVIEKYATPAQHGAIYARNSGTDVSSGWTIEDNEIRRNHAGGVRIGNRTRVIGNYIYDNGQLGIGDAGDNADIAGNEVAENGALFDPSWEAGGVKIVVARGLVLRNNYVRANYGTGLWCDIDCMDATFEGNTVVENRGPGIQYEISHVAKIRNNFVKDNGSGGAVWLWGSQILVQNSNDVEVYGNTVEVDAVGNAIGLVQQDRGSGQYGLFLTRNNYVHDNVITHLSSPQGGSGAVADYNAGTMAESNNRFDSNKYFVSDPAARHWRWIEPFYTFSQFQGLGQEPRGQVISVRSDVWKRAEGAEAQ